MITSTKNQLVTRIRRLRQKKYRLADGVSLIEGLRVVGSAVEYGAEIEALIWCDELLTSDFGRTLLQSPPPNTDLFEVNKTVFQSISDRDNPIGLAALIKAPVLPAPDALLQTGSLFLALDSIADPGNLGTVIRAVDAAGADGILLVGKTVDLFHPSCLKASMGAAFAVPVAQCATLDALFDAAAAAGASVVATTAKADSDYRAYAPSDKIVLLMGSEKFGLSAETIARADHTVSIPMRGISSSLNLAIASSLLLYQYAPDRP